MEKSKSADEKNIELIGIGFIPGFLLAIGISAEKAMLEPFFGGLKDFGLMVIIATILGIVIGVFYLIQKLRIMFGLCSFLFSFISGYLIGLTVNRGIDLGLIILGIIILVISFVFTIPAFEPSE